VCETWKYEGGKYGKGGKKSIREVPKNVSPGGVEGYGKTLWGGTEKKCLRSQQRLGWREGDEEGHEQL